MKDAEKPFFPVIAAGLLTTVLTLTGLHYLNLYTDWNPMGWYANGILPVGALLVGAVAASGYGLASYILGIRVNKWLLVSVLVLQLIAYVVAQYIDYLDFLRQMKDAVFSGIPGGASPKGNGISFFEYWDLAAQSLAWEGRHGEPSQPLGMWGYGVRALEIAGFAGGGLIAPAILKSHPYCERCQRYMKTKTLALVPASVASKLFQKTEESVKTRAMTEGAEETERLRKFAADGDIAGFRAGMDAAKAKSKEANGAPMRFSVEIVSCPNCGEGYLRIAKIEQQGRNLKRTELPDKTPLSVDFVRAFAQ